MSIIALDRPPVGVPVEHGHRDRFVDLLRVVAIGVVVLEHWLFPVLSYDPAAGVLTASNALTVPGAWATTWVGQVMPLVFFAGGAANATGWRRWRARSGLGPGATGRAPQVERAWLAERLRRLAWPVLPLAAVWLPLPHLLVALGLPRQPVELAASLAGQLLWFLAAYVLAVVTTPAMVRLHRRHGLRVPAALAVAAVGVDVVRFTTLEAVGYLNVALVWVAVHQVGIAYADGRLGGVRGRRALTLAAGGLAGTVALVALGPYPASMIGLPGASASNVNPPTVALLALAVAQLGLVLALRPTLVRWSQQRHPAAALAWAGPRSMTIYLWHMPALAVVAGAAVVGLGITTPAPGSTSWWLGVPVWLLVLGCVLGLLVRAIGRLEPPPRRRRPGGVVSAGRLAGAVGCVGGGLLGLTVLGFGQPVWSVVAAAALVLGVRLTRGRHPSTLRLAPPPTDRPAAWSAPVRATTLGA